MEQRILDVIIESENNCKCIPSSWELKEKFKIDHEEIIGSLKSLEASEYLNLKPEKVSKYILTAEGENYSKNGTPEFRILKILNSSTEKTMERSEVEAIVGTDVFKIGLTNGIKKYFKLDKTCLVSLVSETVDIESQVLNKFLNSDFFSSVDNALKVDDETIKKLKKRQLIDIRSMTYYQISKGIRFSPILVLRKADLTADDIALGVWENDQLFKGLNLVAKGKECEAGGLHPLMKIRSEFRQTLLEMGFQEMSTNSYVESSFWNFDSLFQPQQHPARDAHDTFFLSNPQSSLFTSDESTNYVEKVKQTHEQGFPENKELKLSGSKGWRYDWSIEETQKNILRTHTTAVSSRYLYNMAQEYKRTGIFVPKKLFSIDRVFRNETLDATHLAEFHQVEGLIIGKDLGLAQLKTFIRDFFNKIGIIKLKFKPAYNPYTEPSMEIFVEHPQLKRTIEIGNSGVFRPEMLVPMGWPEDVCVIAWGLSLERPAMIRYECSNIRELVGHKVNSKSVKESSIVSLQ